MTLTSFDLIGKTLEEAKELIETAGMKYRIRSQDGQFNVSTRDFKKNRFNLDIVNNIVTSAALG